MKYKFPPWPRTKRRIGRWHVPPIVQYRYLFTDSNPARVLKFMLDNKFGVFPHDHCHLTQDIALAYPWRVDLDKGKNGLKSNGKPMGAGRIECLFLVPIKGRGRFVMTVDLSVIHPTQWRSFVDYIVIP